MVGRRADSGGGYEDMTGIDMIRGVTLSRYLCTGCVYGLGFWLL